MFTINSKPFSRVFGPTFQAWSISWTQDFPKLGARSFCLKLFGEESHCFDKFPAVIQLFFSLILLDLFYSSLCLLYLKYFSGVECFLFISLFFSQSTEVTSEKKH